MTQLQNEMKKTSIMKKSKIQYTKDPFLPNSKNLETDIFAFRFRVITFNQHKI